jgi:hypothetical protein
MAITVEQLDKINKLYPNTKAFQLLTGPTLTFPQFVSGNRTNMFTTHLEHCVTLDNPESANFSTGFEKSFGKYTDSYKVAEADFLIVAIITKNENVGRFKYYYIVQNIHTKVYDVIEVSHYECLNESQGFLRPYIEADKYVVGNIIRKGTVIYKSNNHDEFGNYRYGNNANCCYISLQENEEDACVVSEEYCERTTWHNFDKIPITIQKNQILLNIYGDDLIYRCFPDIGEPVKDGIIYAKRSINYSNAAAELTDKALQIIVSDDEVCSGKGYVADIDIWVNDRDEFIDSGNKSQIYKYYMMSVEFYTKIYTLLDPIVNAKRKEKVQYTHKLRNLFEQARNYLDINIQWLNNNNSFEFAYIVITTYEKKKLDKGFKITDRYGGKCIISDVWPKERMPKDMYGNVTDIIFSPPSTVARANPGQLYETEYNFISEVIRKRMNLLPTVNEKLYLLIQFMLIVNKEEGEALQTYISRLNDIQKREFTDDIDANGIYIIQPPFMGTISIKNLEQLYNTFNVHPGPITIQCEFKDKYTGLLIENKKIPIRKANLALNKNEDKPYEYIYSGGIKDVTGKALTDVTPFDFKEDEDYIQSKYMVVPNYMMNEFYLTDASLKQQIPITQIKKNEQFSVKKVRAYINQNGFLVREYQSKSPIVIGKKYIMVLKQNPDDKFSARSLGSTNQVGIPNKPDKRTNLMSPYSKSSIRNGEMENDNFFIRIPPELVHRYVSTHSTNPRMIEAMATMLLTEDPLTFHNIPIKNEDIKDDIPALMLHATLFSMGIQIIPIYKKKYKENKNEYANSP